MFHACEVKIAKIAAHSNPSSEPGNSAMNAVTVIDKKPRMGTDCKMSSADHDRLRTSESRRRGSVHEREHHREEQRDEHSQQRSSRVVRQVCGIRAHRRWRRLRDEARVHRRPEPNQRVQNRKRAEPDHEINETDWRATQHIACRELSGHRGSPPHRKPRSQISARIRGIRREISATLSSRGLSADLGDEKKHVGTRRFVGTHGLTSCSVVWL